MKKILFLLGIIFWTNIHCFSQSGVTNTEGNSNSYQPENINAAPTPSNNSINEEKKRELKEVTIESEQLKKTSISKEKSVKTSTKMEGSSVKSKDVQTKDAQINTESLKSTFYLNQSKSNTQTTSRSPSTTQQAEMQKTVALFEKYAPESFEYHYFKYAAGNYDVSLFSHLEKAAKLKPEDSEVQIQLVAYYVIVNQKEKAKGILKKLKESKKISDDVLTYDLHILHSVPSNGTLLTHGFEDTYGVLYQQLMDGKRTDVKLISVDFLQSEHYRKSLVDEGYKFPSSSSINDSYFQQFCALNSHKNISISLTFPKPYLEKTIQKTYTLGLTFVYRNDPISTIEENKQLYEKHIAKHLSEAIVSEQGKALSSNYLPMLFVLRSHYFTVNNQTKLAEIDGFIDKIALQTNKKAKVSSLKN
jgi:hypothetical protein